MSILQIARNKINLKSLAEEGAIDANLIQRQAKVENVAVYMQIKKDNPDLKNAEICSAMNMSASTMRRIRKDLAVSSPYRYDIPTKKSKPKIETDSESKIRSHEPKLIASTITTSKSETQPIITVQKTVSKKPVGRPKKNPYQSEAQSKISNIGGDAEQFTIDPNLDDEVDQLMKNV